MKKTCSVCFLEKETNSFHKKRKSFAHWCKDCANSYAKVYREKNPRTEYYKKYRELNKNKLSIKAKKWYDNNKDSVLERQSNYSKENREKIRQRQLNRRKNDPLYRISINIRRRLFSYINKLRWNKNNNFSKYIGCSLEQFKKYLQSQFKEGMTWDNYGEWHIDHIIPLSSAQTEEELYKLNHHTNLQPLWAKDNLKKGNKLHVKEETSG